MDYIKEYPWTIVVVGAVLIILYFILTPVFAPARHTPEIERLVACHRNQRLLAMEIQIYLQDHNEEFPTTWNGFINTFGNEHIEPSLLQCTEIAEGVIGYSFNGYLIGAKNDFQNVSDIPLTADALVGDGLIYKMTDIDRTRHTSKRDKCYYASFLDGHVERLHPMDVMNIKPKRAATSHNSP